MFYAVRRASLLLLHGCACVCVRRAYYARVCVYAVCGARACVCVCVCVLAHELFARGPTDFEITPSDWPGPAVYIKSANGGRATGRVPRGPPVHRAAYIQQYCRPTDIHTSICQVFIYALLIFLAFLPLRQYNYALPQCNAFYRQHCVFPSLRPGDNFAVVFVAVVVD
ncbi:unnamed protein product, partial [Aphis gossypii]